MKSEKLVVPFEKPLLSDNFTAVKIRLILALLIFPVILNASRFTVVNNSGVSRLAEPVVVTRESLKGMMFIPKDKIPVLYVDDKLIPSQTDDLNGDGNWDEIAFQLDIERNSTVAVKIKWSSMEENPDYQQKAYACLGVRNKEGGSFKAVLSELQPEDWNSSKSATHYRYEGPFWENENLAFRHLYDERSFNTLIVKSSRRMLTDTMRLDMPESVRELISFDSGMGAGNFAVEYAGTFHKISHAGSIQYQLLGFGPVRAVFQIMYEDWKLGDDLLNVKNRISIWAGQQSFKSEIIVTGFAGEKEILAGFSLPPAREKAENYSFNRAFGGIFSHTSNPKEESDNYGIALIYPKVIGNGPVKLAGHLLPENGKGRSSSVLFKVQSGQMIHYHIYCGWQKANENFGNAVQFRNSLIDMAGALEFPLKIEP